MDRNIRSTNDCTQFFEEIQAPNNKKYVLEIKYDNNNIPEHIKNIITGMENKKITRAKFITNIKKYKYKETNYEKSIEN